MSTNDMTPPKPHRQEPPGQLLREVVDLVDQAVERVTEDEVEARLHWFLNSIGYSGQAVEAGSATGSAEHLGRTEDQRVTAETDWDLAAVNLFGEECYAAQAVGEAPEHASHVMAGVRKNAEQLTAQTLRGPVSLSAHDLLVHAAMGDQDAWEEIVRRYSRVVWAKVRSFRLQDADAYDAVQMTWLRLAENCDRLQDPERLAGWLVITASHECLRILRQATPPMEPVDTLAKHPADPSPGPEQQVIDAHTAQAVRNLVAELPARGRTLLQELFTDSPRPDAVLARATGIPVGSMVPTRARALQQLRRMLDERGLIGY